MNEPQSLDSLYRICLRQRLQLLKDNPDEQAEAIALHYCSVATIANWLCVLLDERRQAQRAGNTIHQSLNGAINSLANMICTAHATDFGIELVWTTEPKESHEHCQTTQAGRSVD